MKPWHLDTPDRFLLCIGEPSDLLAGKNGFTIPPGPDECTVYNVSMIHGHV